jgi:biopolymer transport protein ExbD/biopolymer transport protein TolR
VAFSTRNGRTETVMSEINMIPFIDIMLVLLIIFMITTPVIQSGIAIDVPQTEVVNELIQQTHVISIDRQQTVYLNDEPININDIAPRILDAEDGAPPPNVYLRADQDIPYGSVVTVLDRLTAAGVTGVNLVTEPLDE